MQLCGTHRSYPAFRPADLCTEPGWRFTSVRTNAAQNRAGPKGPAVLGRPWAHPAALGSVGARLWRPIVQPGQGQRWEEQELARGTAAALEGLLFCSAGFHCSILPTWACVTSNAEETWCLLGVRASGCPVRDGWRGPWLGIPAGPVWRGGSPGAPAGVWRCARQVPGLRGAPLVP